MKLSKRLIGLTILSALPFALWQTTAHASTTVYNPEPKVLSKAERNVARGKPDRAISLLSARVDDLKRPKHRAKGYELLCTAYYQKHDYVSAEMYCDKAATTGSPSWSHLNNRGVMRFQLGQFDEALTDFRHAASIMMMTAPPSEKLAIKRNIAAAYTQLGAGE